MRALFVGGNVDNSELDLDGDTPPVNYPPSTGNGLPRYRLREVGRQGGKAVYAVYAAPSLSGDEVARVISERDYPRRFGISDQDRSPQGA